MIYSSLQHDAHVLAFHDFWALQLERRIRHYERMDRIRREDDDKWDRENGDLNA